MTLLNPSASNMQRAIQEALSIHWRLFLFEGIAMIVLGVLAVIVPVAATLAIDLFVGWLLVISGIVGLVALISAKDIPAIPVELGYRRVIARGWRIARLETDRGRALAYHLADRFLHCRRCIPDRDVDRVSRGDSELLGLDAGERYFRSRAGTHHHSRLAFHRGLGNWPAGRDQSDHFRVGDRHGGLRRT